MSKRISILMITLFIAATTACSKKDDGSADVDGTMDALSDKISEAQNAAADMAGEAAETAAGMVEESTSDMNEAVENVQGKLADIDVEDTQGMVDEASEYADNMASGAMDDAEVEAKETTKEAMNKLNAGN